MKLIEWHREKADTIERADDVLKNMLATGVLSSKCLGAKAAWLGLAVVSYNVLTDLKRLAGIVSSKSQPAKTQARIISRSHFINASGGSRGK